MSLTALAIGIFIGLLGVLFWGVGWILQRLSTVLLPLAIAGIIASLLDPVVDHLERRKIPRPWAILLVFLSALLIVVMMVATVLPRLILEVRELVERLSSPEFRERITAWLQTSRLVERAQAAWASEVGASIQGWITRVAPIISGWSLAQLTRIASWMGLLIGLALVPVYAFYFLLEKTAIQKRWTDYLPVGESKFKDEAVFVIRAINDYMVLFFRGQVLVALCDGVLLTVGFLVIGLDYALLLGMVAGLLSIVPFLGIVLSIIPAVGLAAFQFGDWLHPLLVLGIFAIVQLLEGLVISPKIMGDKVGLHPLTIIIAVMVGTTLLGGIIGGILAIPLTAALRVLMFRYVWKKPAEPQLTRRAQAAAG
jgi:predicted PurR-regulated permease PerM